MRAWALTTVALAACAGAAPGPAPGSPTLAPAPPPPADCQIMFTVGVAGDGSERAMVVQATNLTDAAIDFTLPDRCPAGPIDVTGLGIDVYSTCNMGACPDDLPPVQVHLEYAHTADVAAATLHLGGGTCNGALAPDTYVLEPVVPPLPFTTCTVAGVVDWLVPPLSTASADPRACATDADCVIHCPAADGCCSSAPCGCRQAMNRDAVAAADAAYAGTCERSPQCPAVGCAWKEAMFAMCEQGVCKAMDRPGL